MHPTTGTADLLGSRLGRVDVFELRPRIGLSSASLADRIPAGETVRDVVLTAAYGVTGRWREAYESLDESRAADLLAAFGVAHLSDRYFGTLSEGERKRVQIARSLMTDPELLLLDEPAAGLDLGGREELVAALSELAGDHKSPVLVLVTHHVEEIPPGFTHILLLRQGKAFAAGPIDEVLTAETLSGAFDLASGRWTTRRPVVRPGGVRAGLNGSHRFAKRPSRIGSTAGSAVGACSTRGSGPMGWLWWVGAALALGILEMLSLDLVLVMFAGGAIAGAIAYLFGASVPVQFVVAALTSVLLLFTLRPWLLRHLRARMPLVETNAAALVGREAVVVSTVTGRGRSRQARRRGVERPGGRRADDPARHRGPRRRGSTAPRRSSPRSPGSEPHRLVRRAGSSSALDPWRIHGRR